MRLHLVLLALTLGCATEDSKTDDTSSNGSGDEGEDMGNLLSQVADMATEMAEMSAKIAAQQATIAQLELEMSETLRWETVEYTCAASNPEDPDDSTWWEIVDSTVDVPEVLHLAWDYTSSDNGWDTRYYSGSPNASVDHQGLEVECASFSSGSARKYRITLGYER